MRHVLGLSLSVDCNKQEVLTKIEANLSQHTQIVADAKTGYMAKAKEALKAKLAAFEEGRIVPLHIDLQAPQDHTSEYKTVIKMLRLHTGETITLSADEVRMFVEDEWDWTEAFLVGNAAYSEIAARRLSV